MKTMQFHADFASITLIVNGAPLAVHGEVDITVKQPRLLSNEDNQVYSVVTKDSDLAVSVSKVPGWLEKGK